jgi:hypothetical protein
LDDCKDSSLKPEKCWPGDLNSGLCLGHISNGLEKKGKWVIMTENGGPKNSYHFSLYVSWQHAWDLVPLSSS